ncbi:unnamed protein product [Ceutorhynchus assimilis]|uniref:Chloride channel CLIC-like protein 1 n=1 Tax=Ceutorhynchus assimilis TaxID=467358 RepID=A0A9N9MAZ2_9CUCU|nr:unnamed protein product [Ceutorhynchus assimilis]
MKHLIIMLLTVSAINGAVRMKDDWVDPHDMNTNMKEKYFPKLKKSTGSSSGNDIGEFRDPMPDIYMTHLKRVVSVIMNSAYVDKRDLDVYYGHIRFDMHPSDYEFLVNFAKNELTLDNLRKLDATLNNSFKQSNTDKYLDILETFQLKLYSLVMNVQNLSILGALFGLYFVYQLFKNNFSLTYIFKYLIILVLIIDFGCRYHHLVEESDKYNLGVVYSPQCDTGKMSWSQYSKFVFGSTDCEKKTVTPLDALLFQIKNLIIIPMQAFGTGMGGFGKNMFTSLPWGLNIILGPIMLIFTLILLLFCMTIFTGQAIEFNIFHIFKFKFGGGTEKGNRPLVQNLHLGLQPRGNRKSINKKEATPKKAITTKQVFKKTPNPEQESHSGKIKINKNKIEEVNDENLSANPSDDTFLEQLSKILDKTEDISMSSGNDKSVDKSNESTGRTKADTLK